MICEYCNGTKEQIVVTTHHYTQKKKIGSIPCVCLASSIVSRENKLLTPLGDYYLHPDKMDPQLIFDPEDLTKSPSLLIRGDYNALLIQIKSLFMRHRFDNPKPRLLFSRAIDILHDFHVPQNDGAVQHLSATTNYDLIVITFGTNEKNQALASVMSQVIFTRKEEQKPTWIYLPENRPTLASCEQEYSQDLDKMVSEFSLVALKSSMGFEKQVTVSKNNAASFSVGTQS
jgi:hypothetical protein